MPEIKNTTHIKVLEKKSKIKTPDSNTPLKLSKHTHSNTHKEFSQEKDNSNKVPQSKKIPLKNNNV
jgi:hypothetical protein